MNIEKLRQIEEMQATAKMNEFRKNMEKFYKNCKVLKDLEDDMGMKDRSIKSRF